jgi:hypothetical protein
MKTSKVACRRPGSRSRNRLAWVSALAFSTALWTFGVHAQEPMPLSPEKKVIVAQAAPAGPPPGAPPAGGPPGASANLASPPDGPPPDDEDLLVAALRAHRPQPAGTPVPSSDPRDFEGVWVHDQLLAPQIAVDMYGEAIPINEAGKKVLARRVDSLRKGAPFINASSVCRLPGQPWLHELNMPFRIFQSEARIDLVYEEYHAAWYISLNGKPEAAKGPKPYMGRSIGHWDGATLVVETQDYRQPLWLDVNGTPASENVKLTERIRKLYDGHWFLEIVYTVDDPTYYTRPWSFVRTYGWMPWRAMFTEYNCEEQIGNKDYLKQSGLAPEPKD